GPFRQALHAAADVPELSGDLRVVVYDGVDVEAGDVARFEVARVVLRVVAAHAAADVIVEGDALAEVEQHRAVRVGGLDLLVILDDLLRSDGRAVALAAAERLRVVRLVAVHPADDRVAVAELQGATVLPADDVQAGLVERAELLVRRPAPQRDVGVDPKFLVPLGIPRRLEPDGKREKVLIGGRTLARHGCGANRRRRL